MTSNIAKTPKRLSCVSCRQRKIKCDRVDPCTPCMRAGVHCVFPQPAPPRARTKFKAKSDQITQRLNRLEGLVNALGGEDAIAAQTHGYAVGSMPGTTLDAMAAVQHVSEPDPITPANSNPEEDIVKPEGGRYLGNEFWSNLSTEVEGLRAILNDASLDDDESEDDFDGTATPPVVDDRELTPINFPFSQVGSITDLISQYPPRAHIPVMLDLYFKRYDPIFKVLHRPSMLKSFDPVLNHGSRFTPGSTNETLAFAIFYGAISTVSESECPLKFGADKETLLKHYERSAELAFMNSRILLTTEIGVLQAFCIYILSRRAHYADRSAWSLLSLAVRLAFALDLNTDGESLELSPFEAEMRRRLWWGLTVLDIQGAEDRGMPQLIYSFQHDVKLPANINDEDIDPERGFIRGENPGFTIMTFCMITYEIAKTYEYVSCAEPKGAQGARGYRVPTVEEKERRVSEANNYLHNRYVKHINPDVLLEKKASLIAQTSILKQWLLLQYPISSRGKAIMPRSLATKDQILSSAVSLLELQYQVEHMDQVSWVSRVWIQWHPLAVVLAELCVRSSGPLVDRAWIIVDAVFDDWAEKVADTKHGALWRPIRKLMEQARRVHRRASPRKSVSNMSSPESMLRSRSASTQHYPGDNYGGGSVHGGGNGVHSGLMSSVEPQSSHSMDPQAPMSFAQFDSKIQDFSTLHESTIAMALDPNPQMSVSGTNNAYTDFNVPDMNSLASTDNSMMGMNWEDWDTFFQANGLAEPVHTS